MAIAGISDERRLEMVTSTIKEMEVLANRMRELIVAQPPHDLLGYIYAQRIVRTLHKPDENEQPKPADNTDDLIDDTQFLLEYVHAALASTQPQSDTSFNEAACTELFELANKLKSTALFHAMASSAGTQNGAFGTETANIEFRAKSAWVLLRGSRYQVLEGEFYAFVLSPHDDFLREAYGIGADMIAAGFQDAADAVRIGHATAFSALAQQIDAAQTFADKHGRSLEDVASDWSKDNAAALDAAGLAFDDMLRGGICNVSRHTGLPAVLLADLAFERGEDREFFDDGAYSGTPFRTLPVRKKPLIKLGDDFYAIDPCFVRDSGYRALLWNLLRRKPEYLESFKERQKKMSEAAFVAILNVHLSGAAVHQEVYYKDPVTKQWVENDTLVLIDDVLVLVEAKAGAAATIASPVLDFGRHVQAVQDLVIKAYKQCRRFFEYLASADEVPIFRRMDDRYVECNRLRLSNYRVMFPIGLTVESFSPFSAMCKELPDVVPILGKHAFFSLSIDDLLVMKRFLPTMGELAHYLEVRQALAGMKGVHLYDELDHLGAYIQKNRVDQDIEELFAKDNPDMLVMDGMSAVVDRHFEKEDWATQTVPKQPFPKEILGLLDALDRTRRPGWLTAESHIRNFGEQARNNLADLLARLCSTLDRYQSRYFSFGEDLSLFFWIQRAGTAVEWVSVKDKASAAALAVKATDAVGMLVIAGTDDRYISAECFPVDIPAERNAHNAGIYVDAERMLSRQQPIKTAGTKQRSAPVRRIGRNEPCWCGSNIKFKKCHGR